MDPNTPNEASETPNEKTDGPFDDRHDPDPFDDDTDVEDNPYVDDPVDDYSSGSDGGLLGLGLSTLAVVAIVGVVLFVIPEPLTSTVGLLLLGLAAVVAIVQYFR